MPDHAPKYTIRDDHDPDDEMPTDTDPLEAYQTYVEDRDAGHGDMRFTLEEFERCIAEIRRRRKRLGYLRSKGIGCFKLSLRQRRGVLQKSCLPETAETSADHCLGRR